MGDKQKSNEKEVFTDKSIKHVFEPIKIERIYEPGTVDSRSNVFYTELTERYLLDKYQKENSFMNNKYPLLVYRHTTTNRMSIREFLSIEPDSIVGYITTMDPKYITVEPIGVVKRELILNLVNNGYKAGFEFLAHKIKSKIKDKYLKTHEVT